MAPSIPIATHKTATQIEYETLTWYFVNAGIDPQTGEVLQYRDLTKEKYKETRERRQNGLSKEFGRLADIFPGKVKGSNTIRFVAHNSIPVGRTVTDSCIVVNVQPQK